MNVKIIILLFLATIIFGCSKTGGMPYGYCDPGGPGPIYIFKEKSNKCVFDVEIKCNMIGQVRNGCEEYSMPERKQAFDKYLAETQNKDLTMTYLDTYKDNDICVSCADIDDCTIPIHELVKTIC